MAASTGSLESHPQREYALAHLPVSSITEYTKGQTIYGLDTRLRSVYLVLTGKVAISQITDDGGEVLLDIARPDELFGESAFVDTFRRAEQAKAIEKTKVMIWTITDMEDLVMNDARLAVALLQILAQRNADLIRRIESFSVDNIERRLARSLIRFSERLGIAENDGSVRMMPLTHEMLSRYVGTSREIVNHYMNHFRPWGTPKTGQ